MPRIERGTIFFATYADPQGRNPKHRPTLVVSVDGECIHCVAISHTIHDPPTDNEILLPYAERGPCRTGLTKKSAAICNWPVLVQAGDVTEVSGILPPRYMKAVVERIAANAEAE